MLGVELQDEAQTETGKERSRKRDRFIELLRTHPEELRPWSTKPVLRMNIPVFSASEG